METRTIYLNGNTHSKLSDCYPKVIDEAQLEAGRQSITPFECELIRVLRKHGRSETDFEFMGEALDQAGAVGDVMDFLFRRMGVPKVPPELCQSATDSQHDASGQMPSGARGNNE
jgi:hypothetical protein